MGGASSHHHLGDLGLVKQTNYGKIYIYVDKSARYGYQWQASDGATTLNNVQPQSLQLTPFTGPTPPQPPPQGETAITFPISMSGQSLRIYLFNNAQGSFGSWGGGGGVPMAYVTLTPNARYIASCNNGNCILQQTSTIN